MGDPVPVCQRAVVCARRRIHLARAGVSGWRRSLGRCTPLTDAHPWSDRVAYLSLYRKHRPRTFEEVVGQDHVTRTLVNAIAEDTLHHAYLFTGQRGTGKTSTARILAAAVNCEKGPTPTPCGTCDQCVSIVAGTNVDVVELDMASHGGVDDARELRDRAVFAPAAARRKVYILDEVHMASTAAFNALLKVIEEPPGHVLFTMATTDPQKVLPTIMSRVQRLDLRRVSAADLTGHVRNLGEIEGFRLDDEAAAGVVAAGDGSVRDTLSVLEQVIAYASDGDARDDGVLTVTGQHVTTVLGATPFDLVHGVVDAIADADVAAALTRVQGLLDGGHDLRRFTLDLARHLRDLLVTAAAPDADGLVDATADRRERLRTQASRFGTDTLVRAVELVGEVLVEQRQGPPRLPLELAVARLATPGADGDVAALADRVARLERAVAGDDGAVPAPAARSAPSGHHEQREPPVDGTSVRPDAPEDDATASSATAADQRRGSDHQPSPTSDERTTTAQPTEGGTATTASPATARSETVADAGTTAASPVTADGGTTAAASPGQAGADADADADAGADADADADAGRGADGEQTADGGGEQTADDLSRRAQALADEAGELPPAVPLGERPGTTTVERDPVPPAPGGDDLAVVVERWEAILDLVADRSRRAKAFYEPATPIRLHNGVLLLSYPSTRRFHAEQGKGGEMTAHLAAAIERSTGLERISVDVRLEQDGPQRPAVPTVSGPREDEPSAAEQAAVAEAAGATPTVVDAEEIDRLVREDLGGQPLADDE